MKVEGTVQSVNLEAEGHSTVRIKAKFDDGTRVHDGLLIISTPSQDLAASFKTGQVVTLQ